jgi:hypothetical protein
MHTITLAQKEYQIEPLPFGKVKKIILQFNSANKAGLNTEDGLAAATAAFAILLGVAAEEVDALPISMKEMADTLHAIPDILGLEQKVVKVGEQRAVELTDGMPPTAT